MSFNTINRRFVKWVSWVILSFAGIYFFSTLSQHMGNIPDIKWEVRTVLIFAFTACCMLFNFVIAAIMWQWLLIEQGQRLSATHAVSIVCLSQIGKYLPGNVGHLVGQAGLAKAAGIPIGVCMTTMVIFNL